MDKRSSSNGSERHSVIELPEIPLTLLMLCLRADRRGNRSSAVRMVSRARSGVLTHGIDGAADAVEMPSMGEILWSEADVSKSAQLLMALLVEAGRQSGDATRRARTWRNSETRRQGNAYRSRPRYAGG